MDTPIPSYRQRRYPAAIIAPCRRLAWRFPLSYRSGIVSDATMRCWCHTVGPLLAADPRRRRSKPQDTWSLADQYITLQGKTCNLWRAAEPDGRVLDILVQERCNHAAVEIFLRHVVEACPHEPRVAVTDNPASDRLALKSVLPGTEHRTHQGLTNRAEHSHQPARQRERALRRFVEPFGPMRAHVCAGWQRGLTESADLT